MHQYSYLMTILRMLYRASSECNEKFFNIIISILFILFPLDDLNDKPWTFLAKYVSWTWILNIYTLSLHKNNISNIIKNNEYVWSKI